ncbi:amino acid permease-domain-containing protein [Zopfochytrium polystomum]|nr:amino acid permease-domain-containing protein [Zopfochytrium polystomum]
MATTGANAVAPDHSQNEPCSPPAPQAQASEDAAETESFFYVFREQACEFKNVNTEFLAERVLRSNAVGPWSMYGFFAGLMICLGLSNAWNVGLDYGWGSLGAAAAIAALMYTSLITIISELMVMLPFTGGMATFCRAAFGPYIGYIVGTCESWEYILYAANALQLSGQIFCDMTSADDRYAPFFWPVTIAIVAGAHVAGVRVVFRVSNILFALNVAALLVTIFGSLSAFDPLRWGLFINNGTALKQSAAVAFSPVGVAIHQEEVIKSDTSLHAAVDLTEAMFPTGLDGVLKSLPAAMWIFLGIEGAPLCAEESMDFIEHSPNCAMHAMMTMVACASLVVSVNPALPPGIIPLKSADDPNLESFLATWSIDRYSPLGRFATGSLFLPSTIWTILLYSYACSRQLYSLSKAGYFPSQLSITWSRTKVPIGSLSVTIAMIIGIAIIIQLQHGSNLTEALLNGSILYGMVAYIITAAAYIRLRMACPRLKRPWNPGPLIGYTAAIIVIVVSVTTVTQMFIIESYRQTLIICLAKVVLGLIAFTIYQRKRMVRTPEEVFIQEHIMATRMFGGQRSSSSLRGRRRNKEVDAGRYIDDVRKSVEDVLASRGDLS